MSADNEIAILEMTDAAGHKSYRVADNVSMSYNILGPEIDHTDNEQLHITYRIWEETKEFYHSKDAYEYARKLEDGGYYEYGTSSFKIKIDWDAITKRHGEIACKTCGGSGDFECFQNAWGEHGSTCPACDGFGLDKPISDHIKGF